jgi:hypothetical protein
MYHSVELTPKSYGLNVLFYPINKKKMYDDLPGQVYKGVCMIIVTLGIYSPRAKNSFYM